MFWLRTFSFTILVTLFLLSVLLENKYGWAIFTVLCAIGLFGVICEALTMLQNLGKHSYKVSSAIIASVTVVLVMFGYKLNAIFFMISLFIGLQWLRLLFSNKEESIMDRIVNSSAATFMITTPLLCLPLIYLIEIPDNVHFGRKLLLYLVLVTKSGDTAAYLVGTLSHKLLKGNNHKIVASISPKKSWEGTIGGMIMATLLSIIFWFILIDNEITLVNILKPFFAGIILFIGGFSGDLVESVFKRICDVKDSAKILPGMGGVFDVLDSFIFNAPIFYFYLIFIVLN
jgi:phosphatidate cytidylyltransferase